MHDLHIAPERARRIRLVVLDVDGVLTDGGLYMGATEDGRAVELKRFEITDGLGVKMMDRAGIHVVFVSGRSSPSNRVRAVELDVPFHEGPGGFKLDIVEELQNLHGSDWQETACVCDDLADLPIFRRAGLAVAVANAVPEVKAIAHGVTRRRGGHGAVREFAEALLRARGEWASLVDAYVNERDPATREVEGVR
jgi:3-deoxy-D-manno-octulosonate 8-phosphate phosphatase (KDO 8-P phosphatase)